VVQRAVDLITTRTLLEAAKIDWKRNNKPSDDLPVRKAIPVTK
jgi:hypothetical protein